MRRASPKHVFQHDGVAHPDRIRRCAYPMSGGHPCAMPEVNRVHDVPERSADERAVEARRIGEAE